MKQFTIQDSKHRKIFDASILLFVNMLDKGSFEVQSSFFNYFEKNASQENFFRNIRSILMEDVNREGHDESVYEKIYQSFRGMQYS